MLVIDPWNRIEHSCPPGMSMTEYTGFGIRQFQKFCKKYRVHGIIAAHPAKMQRQKDGTYPIPSLYDIADSAHWSNVPEVGIVIHRPDLSVNETLIKVPKVKYNVIGTPGQIKAAWNVERTRYTVIEDDPLLRGKWE